VDIRVASQERQYSRELASYPVALASSFSRRPAQEQACAGRSNDNGAHQSDDDTDALVDRFQEVWFHHAAHAMGGPLNGLGE